MIRTLRVEFSKARRRRIWLPVLAILGVQVLWALWAFLRWMGDHSRGWMYYLNGFTQLNSVMMPVLIAMVASRLADMEHKGQTFRLLHTIQSPTALFLAKLANGYRYIVMASLVQAGFLFTMGRAYSFGPVPWRRLGLFFLSNLAVGLFLYLLQLSVSLLCANQMIPLVLGLAGGLLGLMALFFSGNIVKLVPWAYYGILATSAFAWNPQTGSVTYYWADYPWGSLISVLIAAVLLCIAGLVLYRRKEV